MSNAIVQLIEKQRNQFVSVCADSTIDFDREAAFATQIIIGNEYLLKVALGNQDSVRNAVVNVSAIGISLNPASKLAYLVPRKNAVCLDISYMGLMYIAQECGAIAWGQSVLVRANDAFELQGIDKPPLHKFSPFSKDRGDLIGVYVVVKTDGGDYLTHTMTIDEVFAIRDRSEAWKAFVKDKSKKCPWFTDEGEMVKKTCVKQAAKYWPRRKRLDTAIHHLNTEGGEGIIDLDPLLPEEEFQAFKAAIEACTTKEAAKAELLKALPRCVALDDVDSANKLKAVLIAHGAFIDKANKEAA